SPVRCAISATRPTERLGATKKTAGYTGVYFESIAKTLVERPGFFVSEIWLFILSPLPGLP
ncbi:hypothetical protein, partial [Pseudomonas sp. GM21]|uniref:hypothetical protein n=1 Tax=Pseudomonas sp. GM21 TaxID=1144325 RepID=UPI001EE637C9